MIRRRWTRPAGLCAAALALVVAPAWTPSASAQVVTLKVKSAGALIDQLRALAAAAAPSEEMAAPVLNALDQAKDPNVLKGLDLTKPIAAYADLPAGPGQLPAVVAFIPVTDAKAFLEAINGLGATLDDKPGVAGFTHKLTLPGGNIPDLYVLSSGGYLIATNAADGADRLKGIKPAAIGQADPAGISLGIDLARIPDAIKQAAVAGATQTMEREKDKKPGEDEPTYQGRLAGMKLAADAVTAIVRDGRGLSFDLYVDAKAGRLSSALGFDATPGSALASGFAGFGKNQSKFVGLGKGAAVSLGGVLPMPESFRGLVRQGLQAARAKAAEEKDADDRRMMSLLIDAVEPTLTGPKLDALMTVDPGDEEGESVVMLAAAAKESEKIEAALREAVAKLKDDKKDDVTLDLVKASGTAIHQIDLDKKDSKLDADFGEPTMFFAFPDGAAVAAVGEEGLDVLKAALATLTREAKVDPANPQVVLDVSARRVARIVKKEDREAATGAADMIFAGRDARKDHVRMALAGSPTSLRLRLDADLPFVRFLVMVGGVRTNVGK